MKALETKMHSSRMRIVRSSVRRAGGCLPRGGGCLPRGVSARIGGVCLEGCLPGGCVSEHALGADTPMTDACENITLRQLRCER